jgi:hypothetical protein
MPGRFFFRHSKTHNRHAETPEKRTILFLHDRRKEHWSEQMRQIKDKRSEEHNADDEQQCRSDGVKERPTHFVIDHGRKFLFTIDSKLPTKGWFASC